MTRHLAITSATLLLIAAAAHGEDAPAAQTDDQKRIEKLEKLIKNLDAELRKLSDSVPTIDDVQGVNSNLETFKYQYQRDRETKSVVPYGRGEGGLAGANLGTNALVIGGVVQVRYEADNRVYSNGLYSAGATGPGSNSPLLATTSNAASFTDNRQNSFDIGTAQLYLAGNLFRDYAEGRNLTFLVRWGTVPQNVTNQYDYSNANTTQSYFGLLDANISYSPVPTIDPASPKLTITLGQQTLPFGLEVNTIDELRPVINNAMFVSPSALARREIGLIIRGDLGITYDYGYNYRSPLVEYNFGLIDGNGPNRVDDNNYKDFIGRIDAKIPTDYNSWLRELRIGTSLYWGRQNLIGTGAAPAGAPAGAPGVPFALPAGEELQGVKRRYGADLYYDHFPWGFTYEWVRVVDEIVVGATPAAAYTRERTGDSHTATVFYSFGQQYLDAYRATGHLNDYWPRTWQPFFRYDSWNPDRAIEHNRADVYTVGLNALFAETTKFQLNLNRVIAQQSNNGTNENAYEVLAQFQYGF